MLPPTGKAQYASMEFIKDLNLYNTEKPYYVMHGDSLGIPGGFETNLVFETRSNIPMHDIRGHESELDLEIDGFGYFVHGTKLGTRFDEASLQSDLAELVSWLQEKVHGEKAVCYDYRLRSNDESVTDDELTDDRTVPVTPVNIAHTDHTETGGRVRAARHLTEAERTKYLDSGDYRLRVFNLWKPLVDAVEDNPLAICNPKSIDRNDLLCIDRVSRTWVGEIYYPKFNADQQWWWLSKQRRNEICAFVTFDSQEDPTHFRFCPHGSFFIPTDKSVAPRVSVELRVMIFNRV